MRQFIKYLSGKFLLFGSIVMLGGFLIIFGLGSYDLHKGKSLTGKSPTLVPPLEYKREEGVSKESAKAAAEVLLGKNNLPESFFKNTTEALAKNISKKIVENNPAGPLPQNGIKQLKAPEVTEIVEKFLAEGAASFDYQTLKPEIKDTDLKISDDRSQEAIKRYVKNFLALTSKPLDRRGEQASDPSDPAGAVFALILVYEDRMNDFLALEVPKILTPLHKKHLAILGANKKIFELINEYDNDPLTSVLALNALNLIRAESIDIYSEIAQVIMKNNIKL